MKKALKGTSHDSRRERERVCEINRKKEEGNKMGRDRKEREHERVRERQEEEGKGERESE